MRQCALELRSPLGRLAVDQLAQAPLRAGVVGVESPARAGSARESAYAPKCANAQTVSPAAATASARSGSKASAIHADTAADPVSAASPYAVLPESRPLAAAANDAASTTIATAKPIENATATAPS